MSPRIQQTALVLRRSVLSRGVGTTKGIGEETYDIYNFDEGMNVELLLTVGGNNNDINVNNNTAFISVIVVDVVYNL